jgi:hypothetical protein
MSDSIQLPADVKKELDRKARILHETFSSPVGEKALAILVDAFDGDHLRATTPHDTYYNLGSRDVIKYIQQMMRRVK